MNAKRYDFFPPITGPWRVSPVHISFGRAHSNRPKARWSSCAGAGAFSSRRSNSRCRVRSCGARAGLSPSGRAMIFGLWA